MQANSLKNIQKRFRRFCNWTLRKLQPEKSKYLPSTSSGYWARARKKGQIWKRRNEVISFVIIIPFHCVWKLCNSWFWCVCRGVIDVYSSLEEESKVIMQYMLPLQFCSCSSCLLRLVGVLNPVTAGTDEFFRTSDNLCRGTSNKGLCSLHATPSLLNATLCSVIRWSKQ